MGNNKDLAKRMRVLAVVAQLTGAGQRSRCVDIRNAVTPLPMSSAGILFVDLVNDGLIAKWRNTMQYVLTLAGVAKLEAAGDVVPKEAMTYAKKHAADVAAAAAAADDSEEEEAANKKQLRGKKQAKPAVAATSPKPKAASAKEVAPEKALPALKAPARKGKGAATSGKRERSGDGASPRGRAPVAKRSK